MSGENKAPVQPAPRLTVTFADWTTKSGKAETVDVMTGEVIEVHDVEPLQLPAVPPAVDGDDDDAD